MILEHTVVVASSAIGISALILFVYSYLTIPSERYLGIASLLSATTTVHSLSIALAPVRAGPAATFSYLDCVGWLGLVATGPILLHLAYQFSGVSVRRHLVAGAYASTALIAVCMVVGGMFRHSTAARLSADAILWGTDATLLWVSVRAIASRHNAMVPVTLGAFVLLLALTHDAASTLGLLDHPQLVDLGFASVLVAVGATRSERYAMLAKHLEHNSKELRARTGELQRSYEDLRATQVELVKKEQLAVVGELAAVIAHEVRNPLAIIANAVSTLRKQAISRADHDTLLTIMDEETSRLNRLVHDLLRYARPVNIQKAQISLLEVLQRAIAHGLADHTGIQTAFNFECAEPRIWGDANLLRQVFENLADNAVQAMGGEGTLTLRVRETETEGTSGVAVDVIDTGEGMDAQVRSRARDPFFTTRPSGTGLGLAIVDRIIVGHGGLLTIESHAGQGTTVTVFLPYGSADDAPISGDAYRRNSPAPERRST